MSPPLYCLLALSVIVGASGCERTSPESKSAMHRERALTYFNEGKFRESSIELRNLLEANPTDADAHYRLALAHLKLGTMPDLQDAFRALNRSIELDPTNLDAQIKLGQLYLMGNELEKAKERADVVLASAPDSADGHALRGRSLLKEHSIQAAITHLKKAIEKDPTALQLYLDLGAAYQSAGDSTKAEQTYNNAITTHPSSAIAWTARGDFYLLTGKQQEAEEDYKKSVELEPDNEIAYIKLANFYRITNRLAQAESICFKLVAKKPQRENPQIILGDFYTTVGEKDKAFASYQRATELKPDSPAARDRLLNHLLDAGKLDEAEQRVHTLLTANGQDKTAQFFRARLLLSRGKGGEAVPLFQRLIKDEPRIPALHHFLGIALTQSNQLGQAVAALTEAIRLAPNAIESRTALASLQLTQGFYDLAIEEAQAALKLNPQNLLATITLGDAYLRKNDWTNSRLAFETVRARLPKEPQPHIRLGMVARAEKKESDAISHFEEALQLNPKQIEPLAHIVAIKIAQGKAPDARDRVLRHLETEPNDPYAYNLLGRLWMATKNWSQAEATFKKALELNSTVLDAYMSLAQIYTQNGKTTDAIHEYESALSKDSKYIPAHMMLGVMYESKNEPEKAQRAYETVLKMSPNFSPAANNLAWLLIEHGGNSDLALSYAQIAREQQPSDPHVADTIGWILYKKGIYLKAGALLKEAADKLPDNPSVLFHYGMAQFKQGDDAGARQSLRAALKLSQSFAGAQEAKIVLDSL